MTVVTPRTGPSEESWLVATPQSLKGSRGASPCLSRAASQPNVIKDLKGLLERAMATKSSSESLQEVLASYEDQVVQVHEELLHVTKKLYRERRQYSLRVMEKDCEAKRLVIEAESLRGIIEAKSASMEALKKRHERETVALKEEVAKLEVALQDARQTQHESLKRFEDAGIEIETAAERLLDAYSENATLVQQIEDLQCDLEKVTRYSESQERYYNSKIADLSREVDELKSAGGLPMPRSLNLPVASSPTHSGVYSNPLVANDSSSVTSYGTRDEDILAAEVTNLRQKTRELESQASVRSTLEKEATTLRAENRKLREMLTASMADASSAQVEVHQLRSESNVLHAQLADVIAQFNMKQEDLAAGAEDAHCDIERDGGLVKDAAFPPTPNDAMELGAAAGAFSCSRDSAGAPRTMRARQTTAEEAEEAVDAVEAVTDMTIMTTMTTDALDDDEDIRQLFANALESMDKAEGELVLAEQDVF